MKTSSQKRFAKALLTAIAFTWLGLVCGISFLEAPTKFTAPSLPLPVALDVGRVVFAMSHRVQLGLALAALLAAGVGRASLRPRDRFLLGGAIALFLLQILGVQPPLDLRTARRIAGEALAPSHLHALYVALDLAKVTVLGTLGWALLLDSRRIE